MPEASGFVVMKVSDGVRDALAGAGFSRLDASALCSAAGIQKCPGYFALEGKAQAVAELITFSPFGQEWMAVLEEIVNAGTGVELYGVMQDEYGFEQVYLLNAARKRLCVGRDVDIEEDGAVSVVRTSAKLEKFFPKSAQSLLPKEAKQVLLSCINGHLQDEAKKKNLPLVLEHEGFQYQLSRGNGYCAIKRENCNGSGDGDIEWMFESVSQAKEQFETTYGLPVSLWTKANALA
jgi:hypothetical protein